LAANTELFMTLPLAAAFLLMLRRQWLWSGLLMVVAGAFKQVAAAEVLLLPVGLLVLQARGARTGAAVRFSAGILIGLAAGAVVLLLTGSLAGFWRWTVETLAGYAAGNWNPAVVLDRSQSSLIPFVATAIVLWVAAAQSWPGGGACGPLKSWRWRGSPCPSSDRWPGATGPGTTSSRSWPRWGCWQARRRSRIRHSKAALDRRRRSDRGDHPRGRMDKLQLSCRPAHLRLEPPHRAARAGRPSTYARTQLGRSGLRVGGLACPLRGVGPADVEPVSRLPARIRSCVGFAPNNWDTAPNVWPALQSDLERHPPQLIVDTSTDDWSDFAPYPMSDYPVLANLVASSYHPVATIDGVVIYARNT